MNTHKVEVSLPDGVEPDPSMHTFVFGESDVDAAGAVAMLEWIRAELDADATVSRSYSGAPLELGYKDAAGVRVRVKLPNAQPAEKPEPTDDEALLRKAAADA